ncbi:hypothetical protein GCM10010441_10920 [Kitasatospora paracochleata]
MRLSAVAGDEHQQQTVYSRCRTWELDGTWERLSTAILAEAEATGAIEWIVVLSPGTRGSAVA